MGQSRDILPERDKAGYMDDRRLSLACYMFVGILHIDRANGMISDNDDIRSRGVRRIVDRMRLFLGNIECS